MAHSSAQSVLSLIFRAFLLFLSLVQSLLPSVPLSWSIVGYFHACFLSVVFIGVCINVSINLLHLSVCSFSIVAIKNAVPSALCNTLQRPPPPPSLALLFWEEAKWCSQRMPLLNNYPFRWNCKIIYGLPHLFQPGSKMLIASKISICGSTEIEFILTVGWEGDPLFVHWVWLMCIFVCLFLCTLKKKVLLPTYYNLINLLHRHTRAHTNKIYITLCCQIERHCTQVESMICVTDFLLSTKKKPTTPG